jgi:hypothetical protein
VHHTKCISATYTAHHHRNKTCIHTLYILYSNNSHFILNISIMARFKPVGKKRTKKMAPAKQGQDNMHSSHQVVAGSSGASSGAAAGAASPVTAPADDTFVPLASSLGTNTPSGISIPSATAATTAVSAAATSSVAGADMPDFAAAACSAAAGVPPPKKGSSKAKKRAKGSVPSATEAAAISFAAASSFINASDSAPFTADAATTVTQPICQSSRAAAQTTEAAAVSVAVASSSINASDFAPFTADAATTETQPIHQSSCTAA